MVIIQILQIITALLLIAAVLLQSQGGGLSPVFGGGGEMYRSKRNVEKFLVISTGVLAGLLAIFSIILLLPRT
jgi:protein translocase SecG subunit